MFPSLAAPTCVRQQIWVLLRQKMVLHNYHCFDWNAHLCDWSPEKDCCWWLMFRQPVRIHYQRQMIVLVSWKFKNPGGGFDWSSDRVAVDECVMWLVVKTCAEIGYVNIWVTRWKINNGLLFSVELSFVHKVREEVDNDLGQFVVS